MKPNVILIVFDTLRKSILDIYGGEARVQNLRALAKDSMLYENCIAPGTWTFPSHVSLFTGMYPSAHGVHERRHAKVRALAEANSRLSVRRLAEMMRSYGYNTMGISNNFMLSRATGFDSGFDAFTTLESSPWMASRLADEARGLGADTLQVAKVLIRRNRIADLVRFGFEYLRIVYKTIVSGYPLKKGAERINATLDGADFEPPFFLFINYFEAHEPYVGFSVKETEDNLAGVKAISQRRADYMKEQYVSEVEYLDKQIGVLVSMLKKKGLYKDALIVLTSDHGQAFNEHGFMYHGSYLYDEIVRVPLIVKYPRSKKFKHREGYQSLASMPQFIKDVINGGDDHELTTKTAFAEAFSTIESLPASYKDRKKYMDETYEKVRQAVYKNGYKLTLNRTDGKVEEFLRGEETVSPDSKEHANAYKDLLSELRKFNKGKKIMSPGVES